MPRYWLVSMPLENLVVVRERGVYGVPASAASRATKIEPGDVLLVYVSKRGSGELGGRVVAAYRVASPWRREEEPLWPDEAREGRTLYPLRASVEPVVECLSPEAPLFKDLVPELGFVEKKDRWQAYLVGTPANGGRPIPEADAKKMLEALQRRARRQHRS